MAAKRKPKPAPQNYRPTLPIGRLDLGARTINALERAGLDTVGRVKFKSDRDLLALRGFGPKCLVELRNRLADGASPLPKIPKPRGAIWFPVPLTNSLRQALAEAARKSGRTMAAEAAARLERTLVIDQLVAARLADPMLRLSPSELRMLINLDHDATKGVA